MISFRRYALLYRPLLVGNTSTGQAAKFRKLNNKLAIILSQMHQISTIREGMRA